MNLIKSIKSNQFALYVAILSVIVQSFHSYTAFYNTSSLQGTIWGVLQAIGFAAVVDLAILFYTVRGRRDIALLAAFAMVVINAYYYYQHWHFAFEFWFGLFLALIIPASVYFYSEEIEDDEVDTKDIMIKEHKDIIARGREENKKLISQAHEYEQHLALQLKNVDEAIRLRDLAINSESMFRQQYDRMAKANENLKKAYNEISRSVHIKSDNQVGNYSAAIQDVSDKSLLNVAEDNEIDPNRDAVTETKTHKIISTNQPVTE